MPLQINSHTPYPSHGWQQLTSFFWDGVRLGPDKGCVSHTLRYLAELVKVEDRGNFSADPER